MSPQQPAIDLKLLSPFFNGIGHKLTFAVRACPLWAISGRTHGASYGMVSLLGFSYK
jgi:hypothetical protein